MGLAIGDVIGTTYTGKVDGQQIRYNLHWQTTTAGSSSSPEQDLAAISQFMTDQVGNALFAGLLAVTSANLEYTGCQCFRVHPSKTVVVDSPVSIFGSIVLADLPANVAVVITKRTLTPGRRGRGSIHLSGVPAPWIVNSEIGEDGVNPYNELANQMTEARTVAAVNLTMRPGVYNPGMLPVPFSPLFDARVETTSRTMRRRTVRVGI